MLGYRAIVQQGSGVTTPRTGHEVGRHTGYTGDWVIDFGAIKSHCYAVTPTGDQHRARYADIGRGFPDYPPRCASGLRG